MLESPIYKEAYATIRERLVSQLSLADLPDDKRKRCNDLLIAVAKVNLYMQQVLISGTMAAQEIERKRTLSERLLRRI